MLSKEAVLGWGDIELEKPLYEENGHEFVVAFDLFNNQVYYYNRKDGLYYDLTNTSREDIYDAIDKFNKIITGELVV